MEMTASYISDRTAVNSYSKGWKLFTDNVGLFLGVIFVQLLLSIPTLMGSTNPEEPNMALTAFGNVWSFFVLTPISYSMAWLFLRAARGEDAKLSDMFAVFQRNYVNTLLASFLVGLIIVFGFIFFIIPGIYAAIRLSFVTYLVIDRQIGAVEAIKTSWAMTKGYMGTIFFMGFIAFFVTLAGLLAFGVGLFVSSAVLAATYAVFYYSVAVAGKQKPKYDDFA